MTAAHNMPALNTKIIRVMGVLMEIMFSPEYGQKVVTEGCVFCLIESSHCLWA